jgi:hypothetical protein
LLPPLEQLDREHERLLVVAGLDEGHAWDLGQLAGLAEVIVHLDGQPAPAMRVDGAEPARHGLEPGVGLLAA